MQLIQLNDHLWEIPKTGGMRVPGRIYSDLRMIEELRDDPSLTQVQNVAHLPGIVGYSLAMPDIHWGYGFPIGGVAAVDAEEGVVSPGGVGYDINCGVRLIRTRLRYDDVIARAEQLAGFYLQRDSRGRRFRGRYPRAHACRAETGHRGRPRMGEA